MTQGKIPAPPSRIGAMRRGTGKQADAATRRKRLAQALRANLRRRKAASKPDG